MSNDAPEANVGTAPAGADRTRAPQIPDHELLRRIGGGSYGDVWLARNVMGTCRAVKVIYRSSFEHDRPFEREFEGMQMFEPVSRSHEGLVDILQMGRNDPAGYFYYVMELADDAQPERSDGQPSATQPSSTPALRDPSSYVPKTIKSEIYHRGRLTLEECLRWGLFLTDALGHLHKHGLIHRDVKPSNIIFVHGVPKLADIGLVAEVGQTVSFVGTEGFIPPEGPGTPQGDLYSLGKVLYEISTGKDRQDYPEPPTNLAELGEQDGLLELNEVIFKACAPDARKRYQSAEEMHHDLVLVRSGKSVKRLHSMERRLALATKIGFGIALLALLAGGAYFQASRAEKRATQRLVRLNVANAVRLMDDGDLTGALLWTAESLRLAKRDPQTEEMHRYRFESVWRQCPRLSVLCVHENRLYDAAFSPDGRRFVTAGAGHSARIWDAATGQLALPPLAHDDEVGHAAFSPDGRRIVTTSRDAGVRVWDAATGKLVCPPIQHTLEVRSAAFSPDSRRIVTTCGVVVFDSQYIYPRRLPNGERVKVVRTPAASLGEAQVWDAATGQPIGPPLRHTDIVDQAAFSPDGKKVVTASRDQTAVIWNATTGIPLAPPLKHGARVRHAVFSPDGRRVLTASNDRTARLWDAATGQPLGAPLQHNKGVLYAVFSPDGRKIVTTSRDQTACLWDALTGRLFLLPLKHNSDVWHAEFSPDGRCVVTAGSEPVVRVWDAASGALVACLPHNNSGTFATFSPEGRRLLTISRDRTARLWELFPPPTAVPPLRHNDSVLSAEFSRDGRRLLTASADQSARVWDAATGRPMTQPLRDEEKTPNLFFRAAFSQDGRRVVTAGTGHSAHVWDVATGQQACPPLSHLDQLRGATFSPDGRRLVTASVDRTARIWDATTGQPVTPRLAHDTGLWQATFSADGRWVVTSTGDTVNSRESEVRVWNAATGQPMGPPMKFRGKVSYVCFSPDGRRLLTACTLPTMDEREAQIWDWRTGKQVVPPLRHSDGVPYAEFSPDGRRVVTASSDKTARVWDAATGQPLTPALKHDRPVQRAVFSPDGRRVVTASKDGTARVWDAATGEPVSPPLKHDGPVSHVAFSPEGRRIVTASEDHTARIWDVPKNDRPARDLLLMAAMLSGQRIDTTGGVVPLQPEELLSTWQTLRTKYAGNLATTPAAALVWHQREAEASEHARQWFAAVFHLNRLLEAHPNDQALLGRRALAKAEMDKNN